MVELVYGIAPDRRDRGYATRAVRLAARWLLHQARQRGRLHIDAGKHGQPAGRRDSRPPPAGTVRSRVPMTGQTYDDLRFVMPHRQHP